MPLPGKPDETEARREPGPELTDAVCLSVSGGFERGFRERRVGPTFRDSLPPSHSAMHTWQYTPSGSRMPNPNNRYCAGNSVRMGLLPMPFDDVPSWFPVRQARPAHNEQRGTLRPAPSKLHKKEARNVVVAAFRYNLRHSHVQRRQQQRNHEEAERTPGGWEKAE